jgi:hypothetical protein
MIQAWPPILSKAYLPTIFYDAVQGLLDLAVGREDTEGGEEPGDTVPYDFAKMLRDFNKHSEQDNDTAKVLLRWHPEDSHLYERCWCQSGGRRCSRVALRERMTFQNVGVPGLRCRACVGSCNCRCDECSEMLVDGCSEMAHGLTDQCGEAAERKLL